MDFGLHAVKNGGKVRTEMTQVRRGDAGNEEPRMENPNQMGRKGTWGGGTKNS